MATKRSTTKYSIDSYKGLTYGSKYKGYYYSCLVIPLGQPLDTPKTVAGYILEAHALLYIVSIILEDLPP